MRNYPPGHNVLMIVFSPFVRESEVQMRARVVLMTAPNGSGSGIGLSAKPTFPMLCITNAFISSSFDKFSSEERGPFFVVLPFLCFTLRGPRVRDPMPSLLI
jgi:hypothetical protein